MQFVIVTGLSGSGKSSAVRYLEDIGFYCVDNIPPHLISTFARICGQGGRRMDHMAVVVDGRGREMFRDLTSDLESLERMGLDYKILFLDASTEEIINRYKMTRRRHPFLDETCVSLEDAIEQERRLLEPARARADYIVDTSMLSTIQLRAILASILAPGGEGQFVVTCLSFGFKYGIPADSDLVFDVRFLPNPYYIDGLKQLSGNDQPVRDFVMGFEAARIFADKLADMIRFLIPNYIEEGKNQLVISIGCTGGKHRSVTLANELYRMLGDSGEYGLRIEHRDIEKDAVRKRM